jgi:1,4-alpha-glucan branching enzyme
MLLSDALYLFNEGRNFQAYRLLGAHPGEAGTMFRVWAPNASRVAVLGDFNDWQGRAHRMQALGASGIWELLVPEAVPHSLYRFEITNRDTGDVLVKTDPYARGVELRPGSAAYVVPPAAHVWADAAWLQRRAAWDWQHEPMNIYEVHAGSWMRHPDGKPYLWRELAERLIPYVVAQGYTHLELLPITEHPLDESWGYQTTGYFAPTARYGSPDDLRFFIDACHRAGLGVLLDWVPGHFPQDSWALARYDGTALYEHEDPRLGLHADWGTHIFNYGRHEVCSFLLSSAHWWLSEFHFDGLRVDAVASMLYLDYSRKPGEWLPNKHGGRENLEAIAFLKALNAMVHGEFPGALTIAEESTAWPQVSRPTYVGGLGFSMKWNMGWMNDSLRYFQRDPIHRRWHHDELTFGQVYAYSENYVLPFSHDEVVHGKRSLIGKMPGDAWQRCANLRLLLAWQTFTPGKKLMFMGGEFGQYREWSEARELDWGLLGEPDHAGLQRLSGDLNRLYRDYPALHGQDFESSGFEWIDCHDSEHSVLCWLRRGREGSFVVVALNFTPTPQTGYRIGVPRAGHYVEILNSDSAYYGGSNLGNAGAIEAFEGEWMNLPANLEITLPPLSAVVLAQQ